MRIRGPGRLISDLTVIQGDTITLKDIPETLDKEIQQHVPLSLQVPSGVELVDRVPVYATITVSPLPREVCYPSTWWPRRVLEQYEVAIVPPLAAITVHGPTNLLNVLDRKSPCFVDLTSDIEPDKPKLMAVKVIGPPWLCQKAGRPALPSVFVGRRAGPVVDDEEAVEQPASEEAETISEDALPIPSRMLSRLSNSVPARRLPRLFVPG